MITLFLIWALVEMRVLCLGTHHLSSSEGGKRERQLEGSCLSVKSCVWQMSLPVVESWCCCVCENEFNRGARSAERSMCPCGSIICYSCRADPRSNQAMCTYCGTPTDIPRFEAHRRDHVDIAAHHNDLVVGVQGQRARLLLHDGQLVKQQGDLDHLFEQNDRFMGVGAAHNNLLRLMQQRITELEAQVFLLPRPVQV